MQPLITMRFGSHLYGTSTPESDLDLKSVHLPSADDILLQRVKGVYSTNTKADQALKNTADDVDTESFALQQFLKLAAQGQTVAIDMLFAGPSAWIDHETVHPIWRRIVAERGRLLTSKSASFVGYCRTQANRYGIRGSRVAAARAAMELLADRRAQGRGADKLETMADVIQSVTARQPHTAILDIPGENGTVRHWEVCNKKMPFTASVATAHDVMHRVVAEYGHRALAAERNEGVDWKALSHAVRIARQAIELLTTAHVTFPRPEAAHLLDIKTGRLAYAVVADEIDRLLLEMEDAASASALPAEPDYEWVDSLVRAAHYGVVTGRA